jgi:hypothetical protein
LCSPNFLYLREDARETGDRVSDPELASRLSYFLWSSMPDTRLLQLGREGRLHSRATLHEEVERMLASPKSEAFVKNFTGQWLKLRQINDQQQEPALLLRHSHRILFRCPLQILFR